MTVKFLELEILSSTSDIELKPIIEFDNTKAALNWFENTDTPVANIIFFADNDLGERQMTGLELIKRLGIGVLSYLVTDSYFIDCVYNDCLDNGVRLIPKQYINESKFTVLG